MLIQIGVAPSLCAEKANPKVTKTVPIKNIAKLDIRSSSYYLFWLAVLLFCCFPTETPPEAVQLHRNVDTPKINIKIITFSFFTIGLLFVL